MRRCRTLLAGIVWLALAVIAMPTPASAATTFRPRIGGALGIFPAASSAGRFGSGDVATGALTPVLYHGGSVMAGVVRVHTIFWAPAGYAFSPAPPGSSDYETLIKQFFTDVAADSGSTSNIYSTLPQFAQGASVAGITPGDYNISYNPVTNSIDDTTAYPSRSNQCSSPDGIPTCVTDRQVQTEINHEIAATNGTRGLHDIWFVFLPPNVDECIVPGACGSDTFAGYHSVSSLSFPLQNVTIYSVVVDPIIEVTIGQGADPEGNPDAEATIDTAAHETIEAITDPEGVGWMDPNGFEVADKCEFGPQVGTPLGYASNGSPFNQVINGHDYLVQESWSNDDNGCVQSTTNTANPLPLPQVNL